MLHILLSSLLTFSMCVVLSVFKYARSQDQIFDDCTALFNCLTFLRDVDYNFSKKKKKLYFGFFKRSRFFEISHLCLKFRLLFFQSKLNKT